MLSGNLGLIELLLSGGIVLGFCAYQYWSLRTPRKPRSDDSPRHPEG